MTKDRVIGKDNKIPWHIPEDLKNFKKITTGHPVIMGRKTYESIGQALPKRSNLVITRQKDYRPRDAMVFNSVSEATQASYHMPGYEEVFIIGGAEIYKKVIDFAKRLYITEVIDEYEGDTYFPEFDESKYQEILREELSDKAIFKILERVK